MFRIVLRDAFKGPEIAKRNALIISMRIYYVFYHWKKGCICSYDDIHDFLEHVAGLTRQKHPDAFTQLASRIHNANTTVAKKIPIQSKGYPGGNCKWLYCLSEQEQLLIQSRRHLYDKCNHLQSTTHSVVQPHVKNSKSPNSNMVVTC